MNLSLHVWLGKKTLIFSGSYGFALGCFANLAKQVVGKSFFRLIIKFLLSKVLATSIKKFVLVKTGGAITGKRAGITSFVAYY